MKVYLSVVCALFTFVVCDDVNNPAAPVGCFKYSSAVGNYVSHDVDATDPNCIGVCAANYYRYSAVGNASCMCVNVLGEEVNTTKTCETHCDDCDFKTVYVTGNLISGPPRDLQIKNVTATTVKLSWRAPESYISILKYKIKATVLHTYSSFSRNTPEWMLSNDTLKTELIGLQPSTTYNVTINTVSDDGAGPAAWNVVQTHLSEPDNKPEPPVIKEKTDKTMTVQLNSVINNNGPITAYQVIVMEESDKIGFQPETLTTYHKAKNDGLPYYIAAELEPKDLDRKFVIGDGLRYGHFYNAPLDPEKTYKVALALISRLNDTKKSAYSEPNASDDVILFNIGEDDAPDSSPVVIALSVAIALLSCALLAGLVGFLFLRKRVVNHRQRLTDNQELTMQGPMIEVENNGYIPEDERQPVNHYRSLKQKVKTFPLHLMHVEGDNVLGMGRFGSVVEGSIQDVGAVAIYEIKDRSLSPGHKRDMLKDLDLLIRTETHSNILTLMGTSESLESVYVALEYPLVDLKSLLVESRVASGGRFSKLMERQVFSILIGVAEGMDHLQTKKIVHKQLCARNIKVGDGFVPKIFGFGLQQYYRQNWPDPTRWTAVEVFRNLPHTSKSDVWSFACLFWEICTLGATPYGNVLNNSELRLQVVKGLRLKQLPYTSSTLYQLLLNCWQLDADERPTFTELVQNIQDLSEDDLTFNLYPNFRYDEIHESLETLDVAP